MFLTSSIVVNLEVQMLIVTVPIAAFPKKGQFKTVGSWIYPYQQGRNKCFVNLMIVVRAYISLNLVMRLIAHKDASQHISNELQLAEAEGMWWRCGLNCRSLHVARSEDQQL